MAELGLHELAAWLLVWVAVFLDLPLEVLSLLGAKAPLSPAGWAGEVGFEI